jgi:hypothetical protein
MKVNPVDVLGAPPVAPALASGVGGGGGGGDGGRDGGVPNILGEL